MKEIIKQYKEATPKQLVEYCLPVKIEGQFAGRLRPITTDILTNQTEIAMITNWRNAAKMWFTTQFPVSEQGTKEWLEKQILLIDNRILFFIENKEHRPIGHVGIIHYDPEKKQCEFDNLVRGNAKAAPNFLIFAWHSLAEWTFRVLDVETAYLRVFSDNEPAIRLYQKYGFQEIQRVPLIKVIEGQVTRWLPILDQPYSEVERYLVTMRLKRDDYFRSSTNP